MSRLSVALKVLTNRSVNLSAANNMFGSIGVNNMTMGTGMDFIPMDNKGGIMRTNGVNAQASWLGLQGKDMQHWAYIYCSPLAAVIDRLAEADTNGKFEFQNLDGTTKRNISKVPLLSRVNNLMNNPNPLQTWHEFNSQQVVLCKIFGYCPVFVLTPNGMDKSHSTMMFNMNPYLCSPTQNTEFDLFDLSKGDLIKDWRFSIGGKTYTIPSSDVLIIKDGFTDQHISNLGLPLSKVAGLDYFVSNICAAMEADNVLLKKKGPLGVFSYDPKPDMAGWTPMNPEQQDEIQSSLDRYGLTAGQLQYIVSPLPMKWSSMSYNLRDLMTKETVRQGIDGICDRLGFPAELMSGKNATYENRSSAEKYLYQNNTIPFSLRRMARYDKFFGIDKLNVKMILDYNHLPVLQEDVVSAGNALKAKNEGLDIAWKGGMITWNEWRQNVDRDTVSGMDIYYNEWMKKFGQDLNINNNAATPKDTGVPAKSGKLPDTLQP